MVLRPSSARSGRGAAIDWALGPAVAFCYTSRRVHQDVVTQEMPMPLVVRPASADEPARAEELVARSINDLTVQHGFGLIATSRPPDFQAFCLRDDPRGVWLAEDDGEIVGFALSWVCGRLWFLAV